MNGQPLDTYRGFNIRIAAGPSEHVPIRPEWMCQVCRGQWPCTSARECLLRQHASNPTSIAMLMWDYLEQYARDAGEGPLMGAFDRFLAWTRPRSDEK